MPEMPIGPSGRQVAINVRQLREARGLSLRGLSARLKDHGWNLSADALNKIENGRELSVGAVPLRQIRRVDVDDLVALAKALGVETSMLLVPLTIGVEIVVTPDEMRSVDD